MKTRRRMFGVLILSLLLTVVLQIITANTIIKFNWFIGIITGVLYYAIFIFSIMDVYMAKKTKHIYYVFCTIVDVCSLVMVILILNFFTSIENLKYGLHIMFVLGLTTIVFKILARQNKPSGWD